MHQLTQRPRSARLEQLSAQRLVEEADDLPARPVEGEPVPVVLELHEPVVLALGWEAVTMARVVSGRAGRSRRLVAWARVPLQPEPPVAEARHVVDPQLRLLL